MDKYNWYSLDNTEARHKLAKILGKILGRVIVVMMHPLTWMFEWILMFVAATAETINNCRGSRNEH